MQAERRKNRSTFTAVALERWLDAVAARDALEGMVLADAAGLVVAHGAIDGERAEVVAAVACLDDARDFAVHRFDHDGASLFLCAVGGRSSPRALEDASLGVVRILDERAAA